MKSVVPMAAALVLLLLGAADAGEYTLSSTTGLASIDAELVFGTVSIHISAHKTPYRLLFFLRG